LKDKTVIVTGGSSGIGKALAMQFASSGANVVIAARNEAKLNETKAALQHSGYSVTAITCDVSDAAQAEMLISETVKHFGRIDVLINNAGISMRGLFADTSLDVLRQIMNVNFWGSVYCTKFALPHLLKSQGSVVGISSIAGKKGLPGRTGYSASKFALEGFLETLRTENLKNNLHVLVACPGFTASSIRQSALGPDGQPQAESPRNEQKMMSAESVAKHIFDAVLNRKRDLVLTTNGKLTVLLNKFFPGWLDKVVYKHMSKEPGSPFK
jgi:short-subunit dehydrogenase